MAKLVLTDVVVTISGTTISDHVASVTLTTDVAEVTTTAFGDAAVTRVGGLKDNSIQLEIMQDFAVSPSNNIEATVYPLIGTVVAMTVKPTSGAKSTSNPEYQFNALINSWSPVAGAVGDLATISVTWPISGAITKATA